MLEILKLVKMKLFLKTHTYFFLISISILFKFCSEKKEPLDHLIKYVENKKDFSYEIKDSVITDTYKTYHIEQKTTKVNKTFNTKKKDIIYIDYNDKLIKTKTIVIKGHKIQKTKTLIS